MTTKMINEIPINWNKKYAYSTSGCVYIKCRSIVCKKVQCVHIVSNVCMCVCFHTVTALGVASIHLEEAITCVLHSESPSLAPQTGSSG